MPTDPTTKTSGSGDSSQLVHVSSLTDEPFLGVPRRLPFLGRGVILLVGPRNVGKTALALEYAFKYAQNEAVIYVATEDKALIGDRCTAWMSSSGDGRGELFFTFDPIMQNLPSFAEKLRSLQPRLIVMDSVNSNLLGSIDTEAAQAFLSTCRQIYESTGMTMFVLCHSDDQRISGDSLLNMCDAAYEMRGEDHERVLLTALRSEEPFEPLFLNVVLVELTPDKTVPVLKPSLKQYKPEISLKRREREVLRTIGDAQEVGIGIKDLADKTDISEPSAYRIVNTLRDAILVKKLAHGGPYQITLEGKALLTTQEPK